MWPRKLGSSTPPTFSNDDDRGFANWPAMRPTFTTGTPSEYVSTTAIWRITRSFSRMLTAENSSKLSAQSPAWRRNALPAATLASDASSVRASPANTSGGYAAICFSARSSSPWSGQSGCCCARCSCHDDGVHAFATAGRLQTAPQLAAQRVVAVRGRGEAGARQHRAFGDREREQGVAAVGGERDDAFDLVDHHPHVQRAAVPVELGADGVAEREAD